jgi:hypothetical protein
MLDPCDDGNCEWYLSPVASQQRWYPTLYVIILLIYLWRALTKFFDSLTISETLQDGSVLIVSVLAS